MDWRHGAHCRGASEPEVWFPVDEDQGHDAPGVVRARLACAPCPVRAECLSWAFESGQTAGVWGGMSTPERRALRAPERLRVAAAAASDRRAREDAQRDAQEDAGASTEGGAGDTLPRPRRRRGGQPPGTTRAHRSGSVGRCATCSKRLDLRADGRVVRHDRVLDGKRGHCPGSGEVSAVEALPGSGRVHG